MILKMAHWGYNKINIFTLKQVLFSKHIQDWKRADFGFFFFFLLSSQYRPMPFHLVMHLKFSSSPLVLHDVMMEALQHFFLIWKSDVCVSGIEDQGSEYQVWC